MADVDPRIAYRKLQNFAEENDLPPLTEWLAIDIVKKEDSDEPEILIAVTADEELSAPMEGLRINDVFAAVEYGKDHKGHDMGDISIDSPTGERYPMAEMTIEEVREQVKEAMRRADEAIGGRDKLFNPPQPEPTLTNKIVRSIKRIVRRIRAKL